MQKEIQKRANIALLEIGGSHGECLLAQIVALRSVNAKIYLICTQDLLNQHPNLAQEVDEIQCISFQQKALADFLTIWKLNRYFVENKIKTVVLNTAQGGHIRNLCLIASAKVQFVGIIHTIRKFQGSSTQKIIHRKVKKYFLLSDFLCAKISPPAGIEVQTFYPLVYPRFDKKQAKNEDETWITIAGGLENRRKDIAGFLGMIENLDLQNIRFIFLGKSEFSHPEVTAFVQEIERRGIQNQFTFFEDFVSQADFDATISQSDFLLPLIHPNTQSAEQYIENQISGMFNLSFSYHIPLLIHAAYSSIDDLKIAAFFYELDSFSTCLQQAKKEKTAKILAIQACPKWNLSYQNKVYVSFLGLL